MFIVYILSYTVGFESCDTVKTGRISWGIRQTDQLRYSKPLSSYDELIHFQGRQLCQNFFASLSEKRSTLKGKNLLSPGSKFFPLKIDLFSEGKQYIYIYLPPLNVYLFPFDDEKTTCSGRLTWALAGHKCPGDNSSKNVEVYTMILYFVVLL